jgi:hypothetical protein
MKTWMRQRPLVSYFVLAYLFSWLLWVPLAIVFNSLRSRQRSSCFCSSWAFTGRRPPGS